MKKEIYIYQQIYDFVAEAFISQMEEAKGQDVIVRVCSPGGSVFAGWGMIAKTQEHDGNVTIKCDGQVASMALYYILFGSDVEALDATSFVLHRANMYVGDPEDQAYLDSINSKLKEKLVAKIDAKKLKELKGVTINDIFNPATVTNVYLTAAEAKQIGLINRVVKMTPEIKAEHAKIMASFGKIPQAKIDNPINPKPMTKAELQAAHPGVYAEIFAEGVKKEKNRIEAALVFIDADKEQVSAIIKSGEDITAAQTSDLMLKSMNKTALANVKKDAAENIITEEQPAGGGAAPTPEAKEKADKIAAFEKSVNASLNLKVN